MQKLQDSVFSILKTTSLSPAVFSFLQPTDDFAETPLGGILRDTKYGWLALGPKFCVVDLRNGWKVAERTFGNGSSHITVTSVIELPHPLTRGSQQLVISLETDDRGLICILHINGSQILRCIETDVIITELALCDDVTNGPLTCFDGLLMAGTQKGEVLVIDLNRSSLMQALTDITEGNVDLIKSESDPATLSFMSLKSLHKYERQGELPLNNNEHFTIVLNEDSFIDSQYIFRNPDGTVRMKAQKDHVRVTVVQYIPQLGSLAVGYNFGAFQIWNIFDLALEYTSQVNVECLPVTHFGFQEPCDDPRAFCYLWVVFSVTNRFEEHEFPLAVMYSLTYQGKRMLVDNQCLYQEFSSATVCFQVELGSMDNTHLIGGRCISTHTFSINTMLGEEGEDTMLNLCQLVWECWGEQTKSSHYGMLLFDLDQWYKDQMPATYQLQSNTFMSTAWCSELGRGSLTLDLRLDPSSLSPYSHATRLEEHFYPNSLLYNCVCLNTSEAIKLHTVGIQRQIINSISSSGPSCLLSPARLYASCMSAGLMPAYITADSDNSVDEQRKFLLSVVLEARLSQFLKRCAQDWATGTHTGVGCTLTFLVDWAWKRAIELKENAKDLILPLFTSATLPDRNVIRCLEHSVQQLSQLTGLLDAVITKCCNLVVPEALSEIEEKFKGIGTVSLYFQVIQWFLRVGLLPERNHPHASLPYPAEQLYAIYKKRREKLHRIQGDSIDGDPSCVPSSLLYVDQLIINEFGGQMVHQIWTRAGSECGGLYPPPSLYALLRLYLLPDISEEHKHSLLLYLLLDYSMLYDDGQYEAVIRRLMQFPPMFGLSTTQVRATQAFWHLDHRDFHFALDQLQCLTGNTLSDWQHQVVLSSLLAQKKSQAALQYLHLRRPAPIQIKARIGDSANSVNEYDKFEDWQSYCKLYLARGLVFEAFDVVRVCTQSAGSIDDKTQVLNYFFKGCRNSGHLSKVLQLTLLPLEEDVFIRYLKECNEPATSDILVMYYLQQSRYLEAEQYNKQIKSNGKWREMCRSVESMSDLLERESARDVIVEVMCRCVPNIATTVAKFATQEFEPHVRKPKPMSVYVKAKSPQNTFTYKSSFIQDAIENASETWVNKPTMKKGLKRALSINETPFICTPKLYKAKSIFEKQFESTPAKRSKLDVSPKTPRNKSALNVSHKLTEQISTLLEMPHVESPKHNIRSETPHSILKTRRLEYQERDMSSPTESRYLGESDEDMETASNHTHYSDSTNKHLRFTIPTPTEIVPTPSPVAVPIQPSQDTTDHGQEDLEEPKKLESPPKKFAAERFSPKKLYKDSVKARKSLSIYANSSLSDDPNTSIESIADIPITLINPKYTYTKSPEAETQRSEIDIRVQSSVTRTDDWDTSVELSFVSKTPKGRRSIHGNESIPVFNRSRSTTPERHDSPITPLLSTRNARSRSRTPEISPRSSPLPAIPEMPKLERNTDPHPTSTLLSKPIRTRLRTPDKIEKVVESPRLEVIKESPTTELPVPAPRRNLRSSITPIEVQTQTEQSVLENPRNLRSRSKTPDKHMSPKKDIVVKSRKSLSRIVLEANTFAKTKQTEESEITEEVSETTIECTPVKSSKQISSIMDMTFSPIANKSILQSSNESISVQIEKSSDAEVKVPAFTSIHAGLTDESVLHSYQSSVAEQSSAQESNDESAKGNLLKFTTLNEDIGKSVLHSYDSSIDTSAKEAQKAEVSKTPKILIDTNNSVLDDNSILTSNQSSLLTNDSETEDKDWKVERDAKVIQQEKNKIVEIEREINEIEGDLSDDECRAETDSGNEVVEVESPDESGDDEESDSSDEDDANDGEDDVISIEDSDSDLDQLQIDNQVEIPILEAPSEIGEMANVEIEKVEDISKEKALEDIVSEKADMHQISDSMEVSTDPLNQAQMSLMTDDNSEFEQSIAVSHIEESHQIKNSPMDTDQADVETSIADESTQNKDETHKQTSTEQDQKVLQTQDIKIDENVATPLTEKEVGQGDNKNKEEAIKLEENPEKEDKIEEVKETENQAIKDKQLTTPRKRRGSTVSNASKQETNVEEVKPTRTRRQSMQSEENTPPKTTFDITENIPETPEVDSPRTRRRSKTPTIERRILTRRASRELSEKDDEVMPLEELTPRRRTRASMKKDDDTSSVVSDSSSKSAKASEERKGRKIISTELTVIPEVEDSTKDVEEYSTSRRITRHQKAVLERSVLSPARATRAQESDPLRQLDITDHEGTPDRVEFQISPPSSATKLRGRRATSEVKTVVKPARIGQRSASVDVVAGEPGADSPLGTPTRGRRASFTRAIQAIHTPKGRRASTDVKRDMESNPASPAGSDTSAITPTRRSTRRASIQSSNTPEPGKRTRKVAEKKQDVQE
ncbi:unnamed protein product [Pieris brassicae]|uniref:Protein ELYS n=1 Tax=Pieris brassicae TaxID=7116 RepID=A0A9P0TCG7_PIEBR|nr:unnamed protein product [Pieris brassicae]